MKSKIWIIDFFLKKTREDINTPPARSLLALFEELKYDLKEIRNGEPVKPVFFTQLPRGINELDIYCERHLYKLFYH